MKTPEDAGDASVAERLKDLDFVEDVRYGEEWIAQLYRLRNIAGIVGMGLGIAFASVAIIIIGVVVVAFWAAYLLEGHT